MDALLLRFQADRDSILHDVVAVVEVFTKEGMVQCDGEADHLGATNVDKT